MRSSRLHWHRPTRRRTPSAGVVRPAGCGRLGVFLKNMHSLFTARGRRLCSLGENGQYPLLTPASLNNGCEQTKPVWGSLCKVRSAWACRKTARFHCLRS